MLAQEVEATEEELKDLFAPDDGAQDDTAGGAAGEVEGAGSEKCEVE